MTEYMSENEILERLRKVKRAISNLIGIPIPYNIIKNNMQPFSEWIDRRLEGIED